MRQARMPDGSTSLIAREQVFTNSKTVLSAYADGKYVMKDKTDRRISRDSRGPAAAPGCLYGVNVPAISFQLHEWDIHIVCRGGEVEARRRLAVP